MVAPKKPGLPLPFWKVWDVIVGRKFGPNLPRLLRKFVYVVVRTNALDSAIEAVHNNMDRIVEEEDRETDRRHIVLNP
jgi:hypothetical protein